MEAEQPLTLVGAIYPSRRKSKWQGAPDKDIRTRYIHVPARANAEGLAKVLVEATNGAGAGSISPEAATALIERVGPDVAVDLLMFAERGESHLAPLSAAQIGAMRTQIVERLRGSPALYANLLNLGFSLPTADRTIGAIGPVRLYEVVKNPYLACTLEGVTFEQVDEAMRATEFKHVAENDPRRLTAAVQAAVSALEMRGNSYHNDEGLRTQVARLLANPNGRDGSARELAEHAVKVGLQEKVLVKDGPRVYGADAWECETTLAYNCGCMLGEPSRFANRIPSPEECREFFLKKGISLNEEQLQVTQLLRSHVGIFTGGAGTGKSYTQEALAMLCKELRLNCVFTASTGMAAKNLTNSFSQSGEDANTLHTLWEKSKHQEGGEGSVLAGTNVIVVDEASMLTDDITSWLFAEAQRTGTTVILVGDENQLEPVGRGQVLEDLLKVRGSDGKGVPTVKLKTPQRSDKLSLIALNAARFQKGKPPLYARNHRLDWTPELIEEVAEDLGVEPSVIDPARFKCNSHFVDIGSRPRNKALPESLSDPRAPELGPGTLRVYEVLEGLSSRFERKDICVMSAVHEGELGTKSINVALQHLFNPDGEELGLSDRRKLPLRVGDPIVNKKSKAKRRRRDGGEPLELVNGDEGVITGTLGAGRKGFLAQFGEDTLILEPHEAREHELRYCISIHGAQGQTAKAAVLIAGDEHANILRRRAVVTAVTRPQHQMITIGVPGVIERAVARPPVPRQTALSERVADEYDEWRQSNPEKAAPEIKAEQSVAPAAPEVEETEVPHRLKVRPLVTAEGYGSFDPVAGPVMSAPLAVSAMSRSATDLLDPYGYPTGVMAPVAGPTSPDPVATAPVSAIPIPTEVEAGLVATDSALEAEDGVKVGPQPIRIRRKTI